jgi:hypothetical protein
MPYAKALGGSESVCCPISFNLSLGRVKLKFVGQFHRNLHCPLADRVVAYGILIVQQVLDLTTRG